ncbi:MAG: thioredoxin-disulfide reductase [Candidatus Omnitrophota bacterium]|jgi:thioredoxin reductase (NADPH)
MSSTTYDLVIIGAGPAGLTAALYSGRSRLNTLLLEKMGPGGRILLTETIENFPGFRGGVNTSELIQRMQEQVTDLGVKIVLEQADEIDLKAMSVKAGSGFYSAGAIIIATGAHPRSLGVPGEEKLTGRGVSYCATCDAPLYRGKEVVIAGGGNAMAEEALYLTRFADSVTIIHRRDELRASPILQEKLKENNKIHFKLSSVITGIEGGMRVEGVKIRDLKSQSDEISRCDGVFVYIGYIPDTGFLKDKLQLDETGFIITSDDMSTSSQGAFACGDCRKKSLYQVVTACGDGAIAADSAYKYLASKK